MQVKAVKLFEGGEFTEEFVFGGENKAARRKASERRDQLRLQRA